MVDMAKVLAVIPARGGSRRLPDKNMKMLAGKPLVGHAIDHAKEAGIPTPRIIVSSDHQPTLDFAGSQGVTAVRRPDELSQGTTPAIWNVNHALKTWRLYGNDLNPANDPEYIVLLQPTSPFRTADDILSSLRVAENTGADSVITVRAPKEELYHLGHAGRLRLLSHSELGAVFTPNGAVYVITARHLDAGGDWWDGIMQGHLMPADRSIDIDWHHDFEQAERIAAAMQVAGAMG